MEKWGLNADATSFCIRMDKKLIGGIILWIHPNHKNYLGNFFLDAGSENKGIGAGIWKTVEEMYPETVSWNTDKPIFSRKSHHFYINKCGFHLIRIENHRDFEEGQYVLRKEMRP